MRSSTDVGPTGWLSSDTKHILLYGIDHSSAICRQHKLLIASQNPICMQSHFFHTSHSLKSMDFANLKHFLLHQQSATECRCIRTEAKRKFTRYTRCSHALQIRYYVVSKHYYDDNRQFSNFLSSFCASAATIKVYKPNINLGARLYSSESALVAAIRVSRTHNMRQMPTCSLFIHSIIWRGDVGSRATIFFRSHVDETAFVCI